MTRTEITKFKLYYTHTEYKTIFDITFYDKLHPTIIGIRHLDTRSHVREIDQDGKIRFDGHFNQSGRGFRGLCILEYKRTYQL